MKRLKTTSPTLLTALLISAWTLMLSACTSDLNEEVNGPNDGYLQLNITKTGSRADLGEDGSGSFSEGDRIGLYINNGEEIQYRELTLQGGEWLPRMKRQEFGTGSLTLSAHYPIVSEGSETATAERHEFAVQTDQSGTGRDASDLLVSQVELPEGQYRADMIFRHALHRLRIELTSPVEETQLSIRSKIGGVVNLLTGEAEATDEQIQWITPKKNSDGSFEAVIFPQAAAPYRDGDGTLLKISANAKEYDIKAPEKQADDTPLENFQAGKQLTIKLTLTGSGDPQWANRTVWVYGITAPEESAWTQLFPGLYLTYYLAWKPEYGWFDCNKLNPTANPDKTPDGMMCWAAAASNLLHWWFVQNEKYIKMYGEKYTGPDYHYPQPKRQESDIFQCFIDSFEDKAGFTDAGINWFIHGVIPRQPSQDYPHNDGGYFKDVFPEGVLLGKNIAGMGKETFNNTIKDALANKKGIGVNIGKVTSSHAVNIWGAEFDENGDVSYIYLADNNDREEYSSFGLGCILRLEIVYLQYPEGGTYTCFKSGYIENNTPQNINRLVTLELGEEYWKKYFGL